MRHERDLRKMLDCFHLHVSMIQVAAVCNHAMVRHQNRIVLWNQGFQRVCELRVPGVPYFARGIDPSPITTSQTRGWLSASPAAAKPVAVGGCACTIPRMSGRSR